jgi:hypothetical protein
MKIGASGSFGGAAHKMSKFDRQGSARADVNFIQALDNTCPFP